MDVMAHSNGYVKMEAEAVDNYFNTSNANSDSVAAEEDAQQLALEQATQDMDLACESLKISPDPMLWSHDDVRRWLLWTIEHYNLPENSVDVNLFRINGAILCSWSEQDFTMRSQDCGEIINTLLDVWKSTGKLRRTNILPQSSNPTMHSQHQQQQFVKFEDSYSMQQSTQFYAPQQFNNYSMSPYAMPSPPSYNSLMQNRQQQQHQHQQQRPNSNSMQLFFNAGEPVNNSMQHQQPMTPPSSAGSTMSMQSFAAPQNNNNNMAMFSSGFNSNNKPQHQHQMYNVRNHHGRAMHQPSSFMGSMPTPSPANSTGNYNSDDCESLESYDMSAAQVAEQFAAAAAAAAAAGAGVSSGNVVAQCLINTTSNNTNAAVVVSSTTAANGPSPQQQQHQAVFYEKYCGNPPGQANIHLWQFLKELLSKPEQHGTCIRWTDRVKGVFKIEDSVRVARLWGKRKNRPAMNYDKLSRSIRQYYKKGIMKKTEKSQRLVYQFCHPYSC